MFKRFAWALAAVVASTMPVAEVAALSYSAEPIQAQVIDAETKQPIAEAIVLVIWELENERGRWGGYFHWEETVTDANGQFAFAGWGPRNVPRSPEGRVLRIGTDQPSLYFYKHGYKFGLATNHMETWMLGNPHWTGDPVRASSASGTQIGLERFRGSDLEYVRALAAASGEFPMQDCRWARIPRMTAALVKEHQNHSQFTGIRLPTLVRLENQADLEPGCPGTGILAPYLK